MEERSAGFVLFYEGAEGRRYLLLRHSDGGHWALPKGRIEPADESAEQTARRETLEETGIGRLNVVPGFRAVSRYRFARGEVIVEKRVEYLLAEAADTDVHLSREHSEASWVDTREAFARLTYPEAREILRRAEAALAAERRGAGEG